MSGRPGNPGFAAAKGGLTALTRQLTGRVRARGPGQRRPSRTLQVSAAAPVRLSRSASVIGGAPAAAVVFARQVDARTAADPRVTALEAAAAAATQPEKKAELVSELAEVRASVRAEKLSALAAEFDAVHSIQRAVEVGSVDAVISARELRPAIAEQIDTWMRGGLDRRLLLAGSLT